MNILLTGASGLLGRSLMLDLEPLATGRLIGLAFSRAKNPLIRLDLTDEQAVRAAFAEWKPDLVVHAAAERRPDMVDGDPEAAERLNVRATELLAGLAAEKGCRIIYISTDYVFDGTKGPYKVDDEPNPLNAYGRMKLAGELAVRAAYGDSPGKADDKVSGKKAGAQLWAIVRIPILYGRVESLSESPVTELAAKLIQGKSFKAEDWASRYPAHADDVSQAVVLIAERLISGEGGIYHFAGAECLTKFGMTQVMAKELKLDAGLALSDPTPPSGAPRPKDCKLDGSRLAALGYTPQIGFAQGIREGKLLGL
ncbi:SDR family oxidoreductase [Treponema sp.]